MNDSVPPPPSLVDWQRVAGGAVWRGRRGHFTARGVSLR